MLLMSEPKGSRTAVGLAVGLAITIATMLAAYLTSKYSETGANRPWRWKGSEEARTWLF